MKPKPAESFVKDIRTSMSILGRGALSLPDRVRAIDYVVDPVQNGAGGAPLPRDAVVIIALHTTGVGIHNPKWKRKFSDIDTLPAGRKAALIYATSSDDFGHRVICRTGDDIETCPIDRIARHVGRNQAYMAKYKKFAHTGKGLPKWWMEDGSLPDTAVALSLAWENDSCNLVSLGLEFAMGEKVSDPLTNAQLDAGQKRVEQWCHEVKTIGFVKTHAQLSPLSRTTPKGQPYDMHPKHFAQIREAFGAQFII